MSEASEKEPEKTKSRVWIKVLTSLVLLLIGSGIGLWLVLYSSPAAEPLPEELPASARIVTKLDGWPKQGPNECGAYSLATAINILGMGPVTGAEVAGQITKKSLSETLSGTRPWDLVAEARRLGLAKHGASAGHVKADERLSLLRAHLTAQRPVIALIESERGIQHYVLVLGYRPGEIEIYDPNFIADSQVPGRTKDQNGPRPGNRSLEESQFVELWSRGGLLGLYRWWYLPLERPSASRQVDPRSN